MTRPTNISAEAELDTGIAEVEHLAEIGRDDETVQRCTELLNRFPDAFELYYHRAQAKCAQRDRAGAIDDLSRAIAINPREPALRYFRGIWNIDAGNYAAGANDLEDAVLLEEALSSAYYVESAWFAQAVALLYLGRFREAELACKHVRPELKSFVAGQLWTVVRIREYAFNACRP